MVRFGVSIAVLINIASIGSVTTGCMLDRSVPAWQAGEPDVHGIPDAGADSPLDAPHVTPWDSGANDASPETDGSVDAPIVAQDGSIHDSASDQDVLVAVDAGGPTDASNDSILPPSPIDPPDGYPCQRIPAIDFTPKIDGVLDSALTNLLISIPMDQWVWFTYEQDHRTAEIVEWATAVVPGGVWYFVQVTDNHIVPPQYPPPAHERWKPWHGDSVEIYLDWDGLFHDPDRYDPAGTAQFIIPNHAKDAPFAHRYVKTPVEHDEDWPPLEKRAVLQKTNTRYVFEGIVTPTDLGVTGAEANEIPQRIGINVAVDTCNAPQSMCPYGKGAGQFLYWCADPDNSNGCVHPASSVQGFCTPVVVHD